MHVVAIIAAGGRGQRLGDATPKQFLELAGRSILQRTVETFEASGDVDEIVVVLPAASAGTPPGWLGRRDRKPLRVVAGGARRQDSVANGFAAVEDRADLIVIHDAARPFVSLDLIARTVRAAAEAGASIAALPARDTVKQGRREEAGGLPVWTIAATLPRETIFLAQTPQAFRRDVLRAAIAVGRAGADVTDEAALAERAGHPVRLVDGEPTNIKITTREDLAFARGLLDAQGERRVSARVGTGYDLHRLVEGRPLILGGVTIPHTLGLAGHSDADAICHAVTDAILGGAGAGDIGRHFPDSDPQWRGASSLDLLARAAGLVRDAGFEVENVDVVVIAERPKLAPHVPAMAANVAAAIGIDAAAVSIKGKTNEGVGELGRGEAIAVHAVAMVRKN
ncbi:MAG TPA: 2-C-methyl-D-erythritol 4-phosphate cytidylyltransferase [Vicinamibacterales bacterium]|nr:2-C-methyl-D-erythritol 4-phosphate cytidylyltransferase [Vicinamibacterales bacterium]